MARSEAINDARLDNQVVHTLLIRSILHETARIGIVSVSPGMSARTCSHYLWLYQKGVALSGIIQST